MSTTPDDLDNSGFGRGFDDRSHHPNQRYVLSSSVLLTSILCLVFLILLVTILHLYARYMLRRQLAQRRRRQAHLYRSAHAAASGAPGTVDQHRPPTGLDADSVAALPKFTYKKKEQDKDHPEAAVADECSVCLSQLEEGETVRQLPACGHTFHDTCIDMWLYSHNTCPLCRKVVGTVSNNIPLPTPVIPVEVVVVVQVGVGNGAGNNSNPRPSAVAEGSPPSQALMAPATTDGCDGVGSGGQGVSRLESFRRMFSLETTGGRRPQQGEDASQRDLERQQ